MNRLIPALLLASFLASAAFGQTASSSLAGAVLTESGAPVDGAVVQATDEATGSLRTAVTDSRGRYRLEGLGPGQWTVVARVGDGGISNSRSVTLRLQQTTKVDFTVGTGVSEHVTVRAEAPLVDRKETAGRLVITGERADSLPLSGRVFTDLALLDSSVSQAAPGNFAGERGAVFAVNGQSGRSNSFLVDGLDNNDSVSGTTLNSFFSQQVIQEFVLLTHQYSAEFGKASGGLLNIVTRRGSNERSVDGFFQGTTSRWNDPGGLVESLPDRGGRQDSVSRYQAGFTLGGPFVTDKAFYFAAYEHQESDDVRSYTGLDRDSFANGVRGGRTVAPSDDDNFFLRTDFNLDNSNTLMLRISADDRSSSGVNVGGVNTPESGFTIDERDLQLGATWTSVVSPRLLSETRFLAASSRFDQRAASDRVGVNFPSGVYGGNTLRRQQRDEDKFQLVQNFTLSRGTHSLKFGLDLTRSRTDISARFNPNGTVTYDHDIPFDLGDCSTLFPSDIQAGQNSNPPLIPCFGDGNGNGIPNEPANAYAYPVTFSLVRGEPQVLLEDTQYSAFFQDRVELGTRWLLDYGLRYDVGTYELPSSARVESTIPNGGSARDTDNLAPRLGFTFTPKADGKSVIRGGVGMFYDKLVLAFPAVAAITSGTEILLMFPEGFADEGTNEIAIENGGLDAILELAEDPAFREFLRPLILKFSTGTELESPYTVQYNLGFERSLGRFASLRTDFIRSRGYHLPLMKDLNPVSGLVSFPAPCIASRIEPGLETGIPCHLLDPVNVGSIAALVTEGGSWYSGADVTYRWIHDTTWFNASYTWSTAEDLGFDPLKGGISLPPDSTNLAAERGRSDGHSDHRLVLSGESGLPWMNLRASVVLQLASGIPFNVTTGQDNNLDGFVNDRPAGIARNAGEDSSLAAINAVRERSQFPLAPVTSLREPSFFQVDLRVMRSFATPGGRGKGEVFLQAFNLLGRDNWGLIEGRAISPNFGRPVSIAGSPRSLEFGIKLGY